MAYYQAHFGSPLTDAEVRDSLGEGCPVFSLWTRDDLTDEWLADSRSYIAGNFPGSYIAVELPDSPWGRAYYHWAVSQLSQLGDNTVILPVMLASMADFRGLAEPERQAASAECLQSLLQTGRPPKHFARIMRQVQPQSDTGPGGEDLESSDEEVRP